MMAAKGGVSRAYGAAMPGGGASGHLEEAASAAVAGAEAASPAVRSPAAVASVEGGEPSSVDPAAAALIVERHVSLRSPKGGDPEVRPIGGRNAPTP